MTRSPHRPVPPWAISAIVILALACLVQARPRDRAQSSRPHRIVSLIPAVTEMLFAMGDGDAVIGVSSFDHYPPAVETRTRVGALIDPDVERILSIKPDLVVVYGTQSDLITRLARAGIPMFRYTHAGLADITETIRRLGATVGAKDDADRLASHIEQDLASVRTAVAGRPRPRTALIFEREPGALRGVFASGGIGFLHDMLEIAGGADVFSDVRQESLQASTEMLLARAPEVILEIRPSGTWSTADIAREMAPWNALPSLPAVRTHRVVWLADDRLVVPGPRVAEAVRMLAAALHPDAFGK